MIKNYVKLLLFILVFFSLSSCFVVSVNGLQTFQEHQKNSILEEKNQINMHLNQWHKDVAESNFEAYFGKMSQNSIFIGTDASENWTVQQFKDFSKPYFDQKKTWDFKPLERHIYFSSKEDIAWFDELLDTWMGVCRGSGVLSKINGEWKIEHYVLSVVIPNDDIKKVIEIKKEKDSKIIQNFKSN
ncbi:MAG: nuclear transport factor 2 family protein [Flavobacteriaceae bacterium]|nr:nuclear transport factor 2 family protein [Flavobacteriaceae bacterium]